MLEQLYEWMRSLAYFMVFSSVLSHVIPGKDCKKYIRFFTGLLLVILLLTPVMKLLGMGQEFSAVYQGTAYGEELRRIEEAGAYLEDIGSAGSLPEDAPNTDEEQQGTGETDNNSIRVEEIRIGQ